MLLSSRGRHEGQKEIAEVRVSSRCTGNRKREYMSLRVSAEARCARGESRDFDGTTTAQQLLIEATVSRGSQESDGGKAKVNRKQLKEFRCRCVRDHQLSQDDCYSS